MQFTTRYLPLQKKKVFLFERLSVVRLLYIVILCSLFLPHEADSQQWEISIIIPDSTYENDIVYRAIEDVSSLLERGFSHKVSINNQDAKVRLYIPDIDSASQHAPSVFSQKVDFPYHQYPNHNYSWTSQEEGEHINLRLSTPSYQGISFGLYGLLQEKLGFKFYHPRKSIMPSHEEWPLPKNFTWQAKPRFDKKGFNPHTQHPIEITEQLHGYPKETALRDVKQYIDWLARNQQNYFQFLLLRTVDLEDWIEHAQDIVEYAHSRGILVSLDISIHSLQQKHFQLVKFPPTSFKPFEKQIDQKLDIIFRADWDFIKLNTGLGEFIGGLFSSDLRKRLGNYTKGKILNEHNAIVQRAEHVIKSGSEEDAKEKMNEPVNLKDSVERRTIKLIHSVMAYSITEDYAPVYENENLRHMYYSLLRNKDERDTWYWPESAYWITYDNSIPLLLLPYLDARWDDMNTMEDVGVYNHAVFTSGWEWGYWLIDWSIARWGWEFTWNGQEQKSSPTQYFHDLFGDQKLHNLFREAMHLQTDDLKKKNLLRFMCPSNPTDEFPAPYNKQFQPRTEWRMNWLHKEATIAEMDTIVTNGLANLRSYADSMATLVGAMKERLSYLRANERLSHERLATLGNELIRALKVTSQRARHRAATLHYMIAERKYELTDNQKHRQLKDDMQNTFCRVRHNAQQKVNEQEKMYRYSVDLIARKRVGHTAYHFGYLYPVHDLHFWHREELQVVNKRFGPLYQNIWNFGRIIGIK